MSLPRVDPSKLTAAQISIRRITPDDAAEIAKWHYPSPYEIYSLAPGDATWLLRPEFRYHAALDEHHTLLGYFCYGEDARIPAALEQGLYADERLMDIGLGMRPDNTGQGLGSAFLAAGLSFGEREFDAEGFRLTVAAWNVRAVRLYEKSGFSLAGACTVPESGVPFLVLTRPTPHTAQVQSPR
ncbi:MAG: GNAT family N-acetyltransferase [Chloroflexota bacterium]|nr:GNAT family N-acetyltransferase [Chloroflexota bacterium]